MLWMRWALCKEFFPDGPPEGSDRRYRATFWVASARRAPVPSESDLVRISATSAGLGAYGRVAFLYQKVAWCAQYPYPWGFLKPPARDRRDASAGAIGPQQRLGACTFERRSAVSFF